MLKFFQFWPSGVPSVGSCIPVTRAHYCAFSFFLFACLSMFLFSGAARCSRLIMSLPCLVPEPAISLKSKPGPSMCVAPRVSLLPGPLSPGKEDACECNACMLQVSVLQQPSTCIHGHHAAVHTGFTNLNRGLQGLFPPAYVPPHSSSDSSASTAQLGLRLTPEPCPAASVSSWCPSIAVDWPVVLS